MPTSAARQLDAESRAHVRNTSTSKSRKAATAPRPTRRAALYDELARLERDIAELRDDFESRIGPLTRAYATSVRKLKELERALKAGTKKQRRR